MTQVGITAKLLLPNLIMWHPFWQSLQISTSSQNLASINLIRETHICETDCQGKHGLKAICGLSPVPKKGYPHENCDSHSLHGCFYDIYSMYVLARVLPLNSLHSEMGSLCVSCSFI